MSVKWLKKNKKTKQKNHWFKVSEQELRATCWFTKTKIKPSVDENLSTGIRECDELNTNYIHNMRLRSENSIITVLIASNFCNVTHLGFFLLGQKGALFLHWIAGRHLKALRSRTARTRGMRCITQKMYLILKTDGFLLHS